MDSSRYIVLSLTIAVVVFSGSSFADVVGECQGVAGSESCRDFVGGGFCFHTNNPLRQQCVDGICQCTSADYSKCSCLPNVNGCEIEADTDNAMATYSFRGGQSTGGYKVFSCIGENPTYELHVISNYEGSSPHHSASTTRVDVHGRGSGKPIVLVFTSYEPVRWILNFSEPNVIVEKIVLISYYLADSDVVYQDGRVIQLERRRDLPRGYGDDRGGGNTAGLLKYLEQHFGTVTSFTGTYQADQWDLNLETDVGSNSVSCDFEEETICGYNQDQSDEFDWRRRTGYSGLFGPSQANVYQAGHYMLAHAGDGNIPGRPSSGSASRAKARLVSPSYTSSTSEQCLKFYYHCATSGEGHYQSRLNVYTLENERLGRPVWSRPICNERKWHLSEVEVDSQIGASYQVVFETVHSGWPFTNMAIDDVTLTEGSCRGEPSTTVAPTTTTQDDQSPLKCYCNECNSRDNTCETDGSCFGEKFVIGGRETYSFRCLDLDILAVNPQLCVSLPLSSGRSGFQTVSICCNEKDYCNTGIIENPRPAPPTVPPTTTVSPFADKPGECPPIPEMGTCSLECNHDPECPGEQRCCITACGTKCADPYVEPEPEPETGPEPEPEPEYEQCWTGRMCAQCDRDWVGRINGRRVCCPHCRQSGLRINGNDCTCSKVDEDGGDDVDDDDEEENDVDIPQLSTAEWRAQSFQYDDSYTNCNGAQYVKLSGYSVGKYVGVNLCSPTRYKIFLSDDLDDVFLNVADSSGHGQDHCEFVGGSDESTRIDNDFWDSPSNRGYFRSRWGQTPQLANIGGGTGSRWTGKYYGRWIECGLTIP
ncbi:uncharacterized protein LOC144447775 [Glandiceps talaboti]